MIESRNRRIGGIGESAESANRRNWGIGGSGIIGIESGEWGSGHGHLRRCAPSGEQQDTSPELLGPLTQLLWCHTNPSSNLPAERKVLRKPMSLDRRVSDTAATQLHRRRSSFNKPIRSGDRAIPSPDRPIARSPDRRFFTASTSSTEPSGPSSSRWPQIWATRCLDA